MTAERCAAAWSGALRSRSTSTPWTCAWTSSAERASAAATACDAVGRSPAARATRARQSCARSRSVPVSRPRCSAWVTSFTASAGACSAPARSAAISTTAGPSWVAGLAWRRSYSFRACAVSPTCPKSRASARAVRGSSGSTARRAWRSALAAPGRAPASCAAARTLKTRRCVGSRSCTSWRSERARPADAAVNASASTSRARVPQIGEGAAIASAGDLAPGRREAADARRPPRSDRGCASGRCPAVCRARAGDWPARPGARADGRTARARSLRGAPAHRARSPAADSAASAGEGLHPQSEGVGVPGLLDERRLQGVLCREVRGLGVLRQVGLSRGDEVGHGAGLGGRLPGGEPRLQPVRETDLGRSAASCPDGAAHP